MKTSSFRGLYMKRVSVAIVPSNKGIDRVLFCKITGARVGSPPLAVVGPAVACHRASRWATGPCWLPPALFFSEAFSDLIAIDKLVNSK